MANVQCAVKIQNDSSRIFNTNVGLRQGDGLACTLFNIALEKVIRQSNINTVGTIFNKSTQILAYADDIDIVARNFGELKNSFIRIQESAAEIGLKVNIEKTNYMLATTNNTRRQQLGQSINIGDDNFKVTNEFVYLGSKIDNTAHPCSEEINKRITTANKCFYGLRKHLTSKSLSRTTKLRLYKTLILPVLLYACETWAVSKKDEIKLETFERRILRKIYGPVCENGIWRARYNHELKILYGDIDVAKRIKIARMRWAGHVHRLDDSNPTKKVFQMMPQGRRDRGRPTLRWCDGVETDFRNIGLSNWRMIANDRDLFRAKLEAAKTHTGL